MSQTGRPGWPSRAFALRGDSDHEGTTAREPHLQDQQRPGRAHHHAGGSIWAFYAFVIFGLTPILWPEYETQILYWSNFLQLVFLPAITVGTAIMNRDSEQRAVKDHHTIRREFDLLQEAHGMLNKSLQEIAVGVRELLIHANHGAEELHARLPKPAVSEKTENKS